MTPKEYIEKFPQHCGIVNENCLEDMACPKCGQRSELRVVVSTWVSMTDQGTDGHYDPEWDENAQCRCPKCSYHGITDDFHIPDLDEALSAEEQKINQ